MSVQEKIKAYLEDLSRDSLLRSRLLSHDPLKPLLYFDSNDYLSLSQDAQRVRAYQKAASAHPLGSGGSMLLSGYHPSHQALEEAFASFLAVDSCLLVSSGYVANLAVCALYGKIQAPCLIDKGVHASIYDGLTLANLPYKRYRHQDLDDMSKQALSMPKQGLVITEGIFSMSGQKAALKSIYDRLESLDFHLMVDEAHSFGILGDSGRGAVQAEGLTQQEVPLRVIPLGKAFAASGAIIAGQAVFIEALLQAGRSLIYSTAISPAQAEAHLSTLSILRSASQRREKLFSLIAYFRKQVQASMLNWTDSETAVQNLCLGAPERALAYAAFLRKEGFSCSALRPPTVPKSGSGLRVVLNYDHDFRDIDALFEVLRRLHEIESL